MFFRVLQRREKYDKDENGSYYDYKIYRQAIAEDCQYRCVYCDSHQDSVGGLLAMEMDHFRPWNKKFGNTGEKRFEHLRDDPTNLVHACGVCNGFKWAHWPTENPGIAYDHEKGWIDPFLENRSDFLTVQIDGTLQGVKPPAEYQIRKLRLNRPLMKKQREFRNFIWQLEQVERPRLQEVIDGSPDSEHARTAAITLQLLDLIREAVCPP